MSGAGNDFVIFDARESSILLTSDQIKKISDRKNIGCDQLILIKKSDVADCVMEIYNSDGSMSGACGNATRCVAALIEKDEVKIKTAAGILNCKKVGDLISVNMGKPKFTGDVALFDFDFTCIDVGNPHAVTFLKEKISDKKFFEIGPKVECDKFFPHKTNVEFAQIINDDLIEVRVFERGAGETLACGSGACAVAVAAISKNLIKGKKVTIRFKGGDLQIEYSTDSVIMTGGFKKIFSGIIEDSFFL
jgi:diaminopimelate epimerase